MWKNKYNFTLTIFRFAIALSIINDSKIYFSGVDGYEKINTNIKTQNF